MTKDIDILKRSKEFTIDVTTEFFFGECVNSQRGYEDTKRAGQQSFIGDKAFVEAFDSAAEHIMQRALLPELIIVPLNRHHRHSVGIVHKYINDIITRAIQRADNARLKPQPKEPHYTFLDEMIISSGNHEEVRDGILTLLLAGRDTTACLLGWAVFFLARHPIVSTSAR